MDDGQRPSSSPFLEPGHRTIPGSLAIAVLARDNFEPLKLEKSAGEVDGYAEGATLNTRFGSFPHSTLLGIPWGSQIRASEVDTGSRGRKRKLTAALTEGDSPTNPEEVASDRKNKALPPVKKATVATSGFIHILRPTPELWTHSLPHRTQVVYTSDYSYILHRIRARPGTRIIEAGAGSGSFTHASARAVYNGCDPAADQIRGKVFSFEYHESRFEKMNDELSDHQLDDMVHLTLRDVYKDGFMVDEESPKASAVFLDLPAPWLALKHLTRRKGSDDNMTPSESTNDWVSPLDPEQTVYICTFSPCIEQVARTVEELRRQGWVEVEMVEISHKRLNIARERVGINLPNERGYNQSPADVAEALVRLRHIHHKTEVFNKVQAARSSNKTANGDMDIDIPSHIDAKVIDQSNAGSGGEDKPWMSGNVVHRAETDLKTHTSYLVFATLPSEWSEDDEAAAMKKWPCGNESKTIGSIDREARKQEKREMIEGRQRKNKRRRGGHQ